MNSLRLFVVFLALAAFGAPAQASPDSGWATATGSTKTELLAKIREFTDAWARSDTAALGKLLAPNYRHTTPFAKVQDRAEWLAHAAMPRKITDVTQEDIDIQVLGDSVAIITGVNRYRPGEHRPTAVRFTQVWSRDDGDWKRVSFHAVSVDDGDSAPAAAASNEANKAIVRALFKAFNDGDVAARNRLVDPRSTFHSATVDRPGTGVPAATMRDACPMCASLDPREITIDAMMAEGDLVTVRSTWRGTYTDVIRDVPISGKDVVVHYTNTYRIADGHVVENWAAYDRLHLLEQLGFGVTPPHP